MNGKKQTGLSEIPKSHHTAYILGFLGALIYFIQHASTFWMGVFGVIKAAVWPAYLVYKVFEYLKL